MDDEPFDRQRRTLFGTAPDAYDEGRPGYPDRVYDLLAERGGLGPGCRVLEIGPGTGQATGALLDRGAQVTAVELSADLADRLARRHGDRDLAVVVSPFETAPLDGPFDLVVAASSFHWVPAQAGLARCADLLRPGGHLALWWHVFGDLDRPDPFHDALVPVLGVLAPSLLAVTSAHDAGDAKGAFGFAVDREARSAEIRADGRFGPVHHEVITWTGRHRPDELRALFATFSPWLALPPAEREAVLDEVERLAVEHFEGLVERPYQVPVYLAERST